MLATASFPSDRTRAWGRASEGSVAASGSGRARKALFECRDWSSRAGSQHSRGIVPGYLWATQRTDPESQRPVIARLRKLRTSEVARRVPSAPAAVKRPENLKVNSSTASL